MVYAEKTQVSVARTVGDIESIANAHGGEDFAYATLSKQGIGIVGFRCQNRQVRITVPLPQESDPDIAHTPTGKVRAPADRKRFTEQMTRSRWRSIYLVVKAKFEAIESGIVTFDEEFLPHIVLPGGATVYEAIQSQIGDAYDTGQVPQLMLIGGPVR